MKIKMTTEELKGGANIEVAVTKLNIPHREGIVTFVTPLVGPDYHQKVMSEIDSKSLVRPTTAQTLSLLDIALQNPDEPHCAELLNRFRNHYLWTATESLSIPRGVFVYDNIRGDMPSSSSELVKLFDNGDERVRFVERGFGTGDMKISEFLDHPYLRAQVGSEEMIPVVERVAKAVNQNMAYVWGLDNANKDTKRLSALGGCGGWRIVLGCYSGYGGCGRAFGVLETGEASRAGGKK